MLITIPSSGGIEEIISRYLIFFLSESSAAKNKIKVAENGESKCFFASDEGNGNNTQTAFYGFGRALWIYLKGYLEAKEVAPPPETVAPATPAPTPSPSASV